MNEFPQLTAGDGLEDEDAALAEKAAVLAERLRRGEAVDVGDCDGEELRNLLPTIQLMAGWRKQSSPKTKLRSLGDFRIVRELGRGGMGVVYEAVQMSLGRRVALKVLRDSAALDPKRLHRFHLEAQAAASLRHPHIVPVFATGSDDGIAYYAMQYLECRDLGRIIRELRGADATQTNADEGPRVEARKPLFDLSSTYERDVARLAHQAAIALDYAHANDVLHRDIKPSNLLIDEKGHLWITDFGVARIKGGLDLTRTGEALGTPRYMSPEQAIGSRTPLDGRTDVYSLGATLYEILTLVPAFPGEDLVDLLRRIREVEPTPPRKLAPRIPIELETIVMKAMAKAGGERYQTAAELADDLDRFLNDRPIRASRASFLTRAGKWTRRYRRLVAAGCAAALLLAVALATAVFQYTIWLRRHNEALTKEVARANHNADLVNRHRRLLNRHLHAAQLRLASDAIEDGQLERASDILNDQVKNLGEDDPRDFVWRLLWNRATCQIAPLYSHERNVRALAKSPDGRTLASGDEVGTIRIWDLSSGSATAELRGHVLPISRLVFSADGAFLASAADSDGHASSEVFLWESSTGRLLARIEGLDNSFAAVPAFLRNQPALRLHISLRESVSGEWRESALREIQTLDFRRGPTRLVLRSTWRSEERTFLTDAGQIITFKWAPLGEAERWTVKNAGSGQVEWAFDSARYRNQLVAACNSDGRIVAAALGRSAVVCRESCTGKELFRYTSGSPVRSLYLSSDGRTMAAACESGAIEFHSLATGRRVAISTSNRARPNSIIHFAFSPDGSRAATSEWAIPGGATPVTIWDVATGKRLGEYPGHRDRADDLSFVADGRCILIAAGPTIRCWFPAGGSEHPPLAGHKDEAWTVAFAPELDLLASGSDDDDSQTIKLWDPKSGRLIRGWHAGPGTTAALAFSPDGRILASAHLSNQDNVRLWDVATAAPLEILRGHTAQARSVAFHPDGTLLASAGSDKVIRLWDIGKRQPVWALEGHESTIQQVAFAPDGGLLASAASDGTVRLWDVAHGRLARILTGPEKFTSVRFSPDGRTLAAADEDGTIALWDVATGAQIGVLRDQARVLRALSFSPDSRILASAGEIGPIRLWDVLTAQELHAVATRCEHVHSLAFAPDGSSLAYASHDGTVGLVLADFALSQFRRRADESREPDPGRPSRRDPRMARRLR
jgi:WD40 repeat protein/serine/threonine protein kinase